MTPALAVFCEPGSEAVDSLNLADRLKLPLVSQPEVSSALFFLCYREGCLKLLDRQLLKKGGLWVEIEPRKGEQHSWPAPKKGLFAQAIGKKTRTVIDATTGWAQDTLALFRMGYQLTCVERSPVMVELLQDGFNRLAAKDWVIKRKLRVPELIPMDAIEYFSTLSEQPDCVYLDPMFPEKRKKSALARKSMMILRDILGHDEDREKLFSAACSVAAKRVVVKSPSHAQPLAGKPDQVFSSKLLRYDVYLIKP